MPDDASSESVEQHTMQQHPTSETVKAPAPPNNPPSPAAQPISDQNVGTEIKGLADRIRGAEKWMIWLTGAIAFFGFSTVMVGLLQWTSMQGQLREMKTTGDDTHALDLTAGWQAIAA